MTIIPQAPFPITYFHWVRAEKHSSSEGFRRLAKKLLSGLLDYVRERFGPRRRDSINDNEEETSGAKNDGKKSIVIKLQDTDDPDDRYPLF